MMNVRIDDYFYSKANTR